MSLPPRRLLQPLLQPDGSEVCSQTSVAMACGLSVEDVVRSCGMTKGVNRMELQENLEKLGAKTGTFVPYAKVYGKNIKYSRVPDFCIGIIIHDKKDWAHAVAILDGMVYDPAIGMPLPLWVYESFIIEGAYTFRLPKSRIKRKRANELYAGWYGFIPILTAPPAPKTKI